MPSYPLLNTQTGILWDISANNVNLVGLNGNGAAGQVLTSQGTTLPPIFATPAGATPTLSAVMSVGNSASTTLNMNGNPISSCSTITTTADSSFFGISVGRGGGSLADNTAVGLNALLNNSGASPATIGYAMTAVGVDALKASTTGRDCTAIGFKSCQNLTSANLNTAVGESTMFTATIAAQNTAIGARALYFLTNGANNVSIGVSSMFFTTSGGANVAVGTAALQSVTTGNNNIGIGNNSANQGGPIGTLTTQSNHFVAGNNETATALIKVAFSVVSDIRDKTNFKPILHGIDFINKLKPTEYQYRKNRETDEVAVDGRPRYGFIAQDILELEGDHPVIIDNRDEVGLKFNEASLIAVLVKAVQELSAKVSVLSAEVLALKKIN